MTPMLWAAARLGGMPTHFSGNIGGGLTSPAALSEEARNLTFPTTQIPFANGSLRVRVPLKGDEWL